MSKNYYSRVATKTLMDENRPSSYREIIVFFIFVAIAMCSGHINLDQDSVVVPIYQSQFTN